MQARMTGQAHASRLSSSKQDEGGDDAHRQDNRHGKDRHASHARLVGGLRLDGCLRLSLVIGSSPVLLQVMIAMKLPPPQTSLNISGYLRSDTQ